MDKLKSYSNKIGDQLFFFGMILFAILLPIHKMSTTIPLIIVFIGFLLGKKDFTLKNKQAFIPFWVILFYYFIHILSYFNSEYPKFAKVDLIVKLPLLLLPFLFLFKNKIQHKHIKVVFSTFVISVLAMATFISSYFIYNYIFNGVVLSNVNLLNFTIIHPSYLSMYMIFVIVLLAKKDYLIPPLLKKRITLLSLIILCISLLLLGSRIALTTLLLYLIIKSYKYYGVMKGLAFSALLIIFSSLLIYKVSFLNVRFSKAIKMLTSSKENVNKYTVDDRIMTWNNAIELIQENPIKGYSIGDYREVDLRQRHNINGFGMGYRAKLNAHNQFLESWLALGIVGLMSILFIYISLGYVGITQKEPMLLNLVFVLLCFSLVESIFQSQGGIMFTGFFTALLLNKVKHI